MAERILNILKKNKDGLAKGIYAVCSANRFVLQAAMIQAKQDDSLLLIEATSNQVDQFGGYSGMTPEQFSAFVQTLALELDFPRERIVLGGDHLGPNVWQHLPEDKAMENAKGQIDAYVRAGFTKIHLDSSMALRGDKLPLDLQIAAERTAQLCAVAENARSENQRQSSAPIYVIGTEVPLPGGARKELNELKPTAASDAAATLEITRNVFKKRALQHAWERVAAMVVQPGVEFSDDSVVDYSIEKAQPLSRFIKEIPRMVYEAHSTDYQTETALTRMVQDHFAFLKVGPWLTFALREAVFALAKMEYEWIGHRKDVDMSRIIEVIEREMINNPVHWKNHYKGSKPRIAFARRYSYSDRVRYYWGNKNIEKSVKQLLDNLRRYPLPYSLISQYMPEQYAAIRQSETTKQPLDLIHHKIRQVLGKYARACGM